jgi:hypothetical protein
MSYNNYRLTGARYISKAGNDSLDGNTKNTPKKSITGSTIVTIATGDNIIGSGEYDCSGYNPNQNSSLIGDGLTILYGFNQTTGGLNNPTNIIIKNSTSIRLRGAPNTCRIIDTTFSASIQNGNSIKSIYVNFSDTNTASNYIRPTSDIFVNTTLRTDQCRDSYFDFDCILSYIGTAANFRNNNIQGIIRLPITGPSTKDYAIQDQFTGTPQDNGYPSGVNWLTEAQLTADGYTGTVSGWNTAVATCINRDPKFNNASIGDFSLQADSPHIGRALDTISNIGGTQVARTILNEDHTGDLIEVNPSAEIDTSITTAYKLETLETQGYIDYIFQPGGGLLVTLKKIVPFSNLRFDTDFAGGTTENNNVPDSEPLSNEYPDYTTTSASSSELDEIIVPENLIDTGDHIRVNGQYREVLSKTNAGGNDTLVLDSNLIATIGSGISVAYGTQLQLAQLNPNRLTFQMRTSTQSAKPTLSSQWDNDVNPSLGNAGVFNTFEWFTEPKIVIDISDNVYGNGDSRIDTADSQDPIQARWCQIRVWLRNDMRV